jgi:hypothetical protein
MSNMEWAKNEVRLALEREASVDDESIGIGYEYVKNCFESALKAYESLCDDGHSGMSISVTRNILDRLIKHQTLTPIEDTEDVWTEKFWKREDDQNRLYQCNRMTCFWKRVYPDGTIIYSDNERVCGVNMNNPECTYYSRLATSIVDDLYPITMPYCPPNRPFKVYAEEFLFDARNGDYDTVYIHYIQTPEGDKVDVNRVFTESEDRPGMQEITLDEFEKLKRSSNE